MNVWIDDGNVEEEWMSKCTGGWLDRWMDGQAGQLMNARLRTDWYITDRNERQKGGQIND